jgi:hypothetical protein
MRTLHTLRTLVVYSALALVTLEVCARIDDRLRHGAALLVPYTIDAIFQPSEFGLTGRPHARFTKWSLNSLGYRGPEPIAGRPTVVTFGASETFGLYETPGMEYPRQLERALEHAEGGPFSVVNLAVPGMSIGKVGYLEQAVERLHPRVAVFYASPAHYIGVTRPFCGRPTAPVRSEVGLVDHVRIAGKLRELGKRLLPVRTMTALRRWETERQARHLRVQARVPDETIAAFTTDLGCVVDAARARGVVPVLVTHATLFGTDRSHPLGEPERQQLVAWRRFYPDLAEEGFLDLELRANAALRRFAEQNGVRVVDAELALQGGPAQFADFVHFTDRGASDLARLLAPVVVAAARGPQAPM